MKRCFHAWCAAALLNVGAVGVAHAQPWPARPVRLVVPFGPGGAADIVARILGERHHRHGNCRAGAARRLYHRHAVDDFVDQLARHRRSGGHAGAGGHAPVAGTSCASRKRPTRARLLDLGTDVVVEPPAVFAAFIRKEVDSFGKFVRDAGLKFE